MKKRVLPKMLVEGDSDQAKRRRREQLQQVLECLREAEFPRDYAQFAQFADALRNETVQGKRVQNRWRIHAAQPLKIPNISGSLMICPVVIFLALLQADLASTTARRWENLTAGLPSPKRRQAAYEVVPARQAQLYKEARLEEETALQRLRDELDGTAAFKKFQDAFLNSGQGKSKKRDAKARQKQAQRKQDFTPRHPRIRAWSQPMSQADYVEATAHNRKAVERWLKKINIKPAHPGGHAGIPDRYGADVNLMILARWIDGIKTPLHAGGLAAATIAYADVNDRAFVPEIIRALSPVLESRGLMDSTSAMIPAHYQLYSSSQV